MEKNNHHRGGGKKGGGVCLANRMQIGYQHGFTYFLQPA